jgi:pimeloyl-ACP methyl ester carboxylesterase
MTTVEQDKQTPTGRMQAHTVRGGGLRLHVREWGKADGPPILFIHGWSQNAVLLRLAYLGVTNTLAPLRLLTECRASALSLPKSHPPWLETDVS